MIALQKIRELTLSEPTAPGRAAHLSAASGLAVVGRNIYVVADDELHLGVFEAAGVAPGKLVRLLDGVLPDAKPERKRRKPDLEALTPLPPFDRFAHGALLALASGSTQHRRGGALLALDPHGGIQSAPQAVDLSPLLAPLEDKFPMLNIEGAAIAGGEFKLFQRGNRRHPVNAVIGFALPAILDSLGVGGAAGFEPSTLRTYDLGGVGGIPFSFTDAAALADETIVFTAVAEDTEDSYRDGPCIGAAIGMLDTNGRLAWMRQLDEPLKIEGVDARSEGGGIRLLLVTDADDPDCPAGLFAATLDAH